ncbi:uncharacterized protein LOC129240450 [Anastrepha obliqua]|uniref:uncharacterized protein LOC129240450 n=1 Tax=Anastrepha obliqua TaxID=95512 RepID=UPI00240A50E8|nr:uncharacterized protein LOC129240450 [Anastrepha obliqua]
MENIDENKRKPRRTRGTPAYQYRNKFAFAWIALGSVLFAAWACTPVFQKANKSICDVLSHPTEEEIDRRYLFSLPKPLPSREIQKRIDEGKEISSQR